LKLTFFLNNTELRRCLYALMSQFGPILDIVAMKTMRLRGQAFVVFKEIASATMAIRKLQGFSFFDKPIVR
jgi:U2 small nuclear ribonucleoprotein B''